MQNCLQAKTLHYSIVKATSSVPLMFIKWNVKTFADLFHHAEF